MDFAHLHVHTGYSYQDGITDIDGLLDKAVSSGMSSIAVTDHGNMDCAIRFFSAARKKEIRPIIGCELYFTREPEIRDRAFTYHLTVLAMNNEGYRNLMRLVSAGTRHFYYKPRVTPDLLRQYSEGLMGLSACLGGEIASLVRRGEDEKLILDTVREYRDIFHGNFHLELMRNGFEEQDMVNEALLDIERTLGVGCVPTNDVHYLNPEDSELRDYISRISDGNDDESNGQLWLRTPEEMTDIFGSALCARTLDVANACDVDIPLGKSVFPVYETPGMTPEEEIRSRARKGLSDRGLDGKKEYVERLESELSQIVSNGFSTYLLIVADFIREARKKGIAVGPGRGSAAGSLVCYSLEITDLDPLPYNLLFERFINPERVSLPDIDVDFCEIRRPEMIHYMMERYGEDKVAKILNVNTLQAKMAIRDVARAMSLPRRGESYSEEEIPLSDVNALSKVVDAAGKVKLSDGNNVIGQLMQDGAFDDLVNGRPVMRKLLELARKAEGIPRGRGVHAAGIVVADTAVTDYAPIWLDKDGMPVTQYDKVDIEKAGLVKIDFLGLSNMTIIQLATRYIEAAGKGRIDMRKIPLDDPEVFDLYARGEMDGIFQMESAGMRKYLGQLKPKHFEDLIALIALYRPGPLGSGMTADFVARSQGKAEVSYFGLDDLLEDILRPTYGVIVYQEQVMQIARAVSGFSLGQADLLRRAMGKKKPKEMAAQHDNFINGAVRNGVGKDIAEQLFSMIAKFAEYGFNKSHSAAYALISYQTAWLKTHYPVEFMAALMEVEKDDMKKLGHYARVCKGRIAIRPPDILHSGKAFRPDGDDILFGLSGLKGVPEKALDDLTLLQEKWARGVDTPVSVAGVMSQSPNFNLKFLESMTKCGAFDRFMENGADDRYKIMANAKTIASYAKNIAKKREAKERERKTRPLLDISLDLGNTYECDRRPGIGLPADDQKWHPAGRDALAKAKAEWGLTARLRHERDVMGFRVSDEHPVNAWTKDVPERIRIADAADGDDGVMVVYVDSLAMRYTRKDGSPFATGVVEDDTGEMNIIIWPKEWAAMTKSRSAPEPGKCYRITGSFRPDTFSHDGEGEPPLQIIARSCVDLEGDGPETAAPGEIVSYRVPMEYIFDEDGGLTAHGIRLRDIVGELVKKGEKMDDADVVPVRIIAEAKDVPDGDPRILDKGFSGFMNRTAFERELSAWRSATEETRTRKRCEGTMPRVSRGFSAVRHKDTYPDARPRTERRIGNGQVPEPKIPGEGASGMRP